jgi:hypothetical protein
LLLLLLLVLLAEWLLRHDELPTVGTLHELRGRLLLLLLVRHRQGGVNGAVHLISLLLLLLW